MDRSVWRATVYGVTKSRLSWMPKHSTLTNDVFWRQIVFFWSFLIEMGFPHCSIGKKSACNVGDPALIPGSGRSPGEGTGSPLQYSCLEDPRGQRSLAGY